MSRDTAQRRRTEVTLRAANSHEHQNAPANVAVRTIVSHSNVRDYLLQYSLSLRELLVLRLRSLELLAELLDARCMSLRSARTGTGTRTCIFPRWKNLASWLIVRLSPRSDHGQGRMLRPDGT